MDVNLGWGLCYVSYQVDSPGKVMDNYEILGQLYDDITLRYFITKEINVSSSIRSSFSLRHLRYVENIDSEYFPIFVGLGVWTFSE
ncbi:hypothetical protein [Phaeocystidibacter marisrubri]|uniref:Uncharacterized protein n=1 Tax=Phaeocystidibacter marisrubri TaxID=1577780 RepID=A0A6L3ZH89_9FLAO|nr:hypothetical protein [Phaeocystidibacter marisrubri]KAB2817382.1 hypothetical protein F8C82_03020 [Phaeocystidibacter marisrubri]GGH75630.1 hypothetical protein GCM10011318_22850 [Phaeocystidibacter marisrubri]